MESEIVSSLRSLITAQESPPDMSIILVCWNNKGFLKPCLDSLYESEIRTRFDIVVVDNGSTDNSQEMLREKFPEVAIIQNEHNSGLSKASNQGIEATNGRYVLLLNNDTIVNGPSLDAMVEFLDHHPDVGAVGGRLLNPDGSVQACYNHFPSLWEEFLISTRIGEMLRKGYPSITDEEEIKSVGWLSSACLLLRRSAIEQVGLLDEEYFIYGDEVDLQARLKQQGWKIYFLPHVSTIHYGGGSMNRWGRRKMVYRGQMLFFKKNYGPVRTIALRVMLGVLSLGKMIIWGISYPIPRMRKRARNELISNLDVFNLCLRLF
jgi:N-acetylglucosaminyl-diphospho-decaprenol L-rhamnosyltransferase